MKNIEFVALDFETANEARSSVCEIGLSFVENGEIVNTRSWLVKPEDNHYSSYNISIHGIAPKDTLDKPEFDVVWKEIFPLIDGKMVIAHTAAFDMYVLRDVLDLYGLDYPNIKTMCSCTLSRRTFPRLISYSLAPICDYLNIPLLNHHRAGDDAEACAKICLKAFEKTGVSDFSMLADTHRIIPGTMSHESKSYTGPGTKGKLYDHKDIDARTIEGDASKHDVENLFYGKVVVFTGTLMGIVRKDAWQIIADIGGIFEKSVTSRTNFLVVGQQDFKIVGESGLSGKQKKAMQLLQKGQDIEIISEKDFLENIPFKNYCLH
ncbi:MAG: 3'-5' exoribonuclease [Prevotellaceae bacterium]|jgi:DNA polymerase-3 subunit epsilon|nr:3'-5' exoribonuclease [Prevotellaceae bacterium]